MRKTLPKLIVLVIVMSMVALSACAAPAAPAPAKSTTAQTESPAAAPPKAAEKAPEKSAEKAPAAAPVKAVEKAPEKAAEKPETANLRISIVPIAGALMYYVADKMGYFRDEGLSVEFITLAGGAEMIPALQSGRIHIAYANNVSNLQAIEQGIDLMLIAGANPVGSNKPDQSSIVVLKDSGIKKPKDLEGKKLAVNTLNGINWLYTKVWLERGGADTTKVSFREMPFPQMGDALLSKQVDALSDAEPFRTVVLGSGKAEEIGYPFVEVHPNSMDIASAIAISKWVKENPVTVKKFARAYYKAVDYIHQNDKEARRMMAEFSKMDPELAQKVVMILIDGKINPKSIENMAELLVANGLLKSKPDVSKFIYETAINPPK